MKNKWNKRLHTPSFIFVRGGSRGGGGGGGLRGLQPPVL